MSTYSNTNRPAAAPVILELPGMSLHGFTGTLTLTGETGAEIITTLRSMQAAGMVQTAPAPALVAPAASASSGPPMCPTHQRPMKESRKPGTYYCSAKVGDGYCDHKVKA